MPWAKVQRRIAQLIKADQFYTPEEYDRLDDIDPIAIREALAERGILYPEEPRRRNHTGSAILCILIYALPLLRRPPAFRIGSPQRFFAFSYGSPDWHNFEKERAEALSFVV